ncbi:MAG: polysaccharide deacetylase, partial [Ramlibacter sp.]|nr:polysaccharide deacetylase [Ramlibacter sp.]
MNSAIGASVRARAPYQSIVKRPRLRLPGDARVVVWYIVNVEVW